MRVNVVDIIKGIAIIMIVNVHLVSGQFFSIGSTYHVIAFFFTTGVIHHYYETSRHLSFKSFLNKKITKLLYPYLTLSLCYILFRLVLNLIRNDVFINHVIIDSIIQTISFRGVGTLWFLPVLFGGEILHFIFKKKIRYSCVILLFGISSVFISSYLNHRGVCGLQWYGDNTLYGVFVNTPLTLFLSSIIACLFIEIGYLLYEIIPHYFTDNIKGKKQLIIILCCITSLIINISIIEHYKGDLHKLDIGNPCIYLLCSLLGIVFVFTLSVIINSFCKFLSILLTFFGRNSLIIMTTHSEYFINFIAFVVVTYLQSILNFSIEIKIISGISLAVILFIEVWVVYLVNHSFIKYIYNPIPIKDKTLDKRLTELSKK